MDIILYKYYSVVIRDKVQKGCKSCYSSRRGIVIFDYKKKKERMNFIRIVRWRKRKGIYENSFENVTVDQSSREGTKTIVGTCGGQFKFSGSCARPPLRAVPRRDALTFYLPLRSMQLRNIWLRRVPISKFPARPASSFT